MKKYYARLGIEPQACKMMSFESYQLLVEFIVYKLKKNAEMD